MFSRRVFREVLAILVILAALLFDLYASTMSVESFVGAFLVTTGAVIFAWLLWRD